MREIKMVVAAAVFVIGMRWLCSGPIAHAEPQPAFDRALVERLVRAEEAQARAAEDQARELHEIRRAIETAGRH